MTIPSDGWKAVTHGSNWTNRKTGASCIVQSTATSMASKVRLLHQSGRVTTKQVHYFLYEFARVIEMDVKAKVQDWVNLQAAMKAAGDAGDSHAEQRFCDAASEVERQLRDTGHEIRDLVCP